MLQAVRNSVSEEKSSLCLFFLFFTSSIDSRVRRVIKQRGWKKNPCSGSSSSAPIFRLFLFVPFTRLPLKLSDSAAYDRSSAPINRDAHARVSARRTVSGSGLCDCVLGSSDPHWIERERRDWGWVWVRSTVVWLGRAAPRPPSVRTRVCVCVVVCIYLSRLFPRSLSVCQPVCPSVCLCSLSSLCCDHTETPGRERGVGEVTSVEVPLSPTLLNRPHLPILHPCTSPASAGMCTWTWLFWWEAFC